MFDPSSAAYNKKLRGKTEVRGNSFQYARISEIIPDSMIDPRNLEILKKVINSGKKFTDKEFDVLRHLHDTLLGVPREKIALDKVEFMHPVESAKKLFPGKKYHVFNDVDPGDIIQGVLGDCYFLCAISAMAERPKLITRLFDIQVVNGYNIYSIWFNINGLWKQILIDEALPALSTDDHTFHPFSKCSEGEDEIYTMLLEKAYAKAYGSYLRIDGGTPLNALRDLTGAPCKFYKNLRALTPSQKLKMWNQLLNAENMNYIMCASTPVGETSEEDLGNGLYAGHAYSVLTAVEVKYTLNGFIQQEKLLEIRNPWGQGEWQGIWRDSSPHWNQVIEPKIRPVDKNDGIFWMSLNEFTANFEDAGICMVQEGCFYNAVSIPSMDKTANKSLILFDITLAGKYAISADQRDLKSEPAIDEFSRKITYVDMFILVGRINTNGTISYIGHNQQFDINTFVHEDMLPGRYFAITRPWVGNSEPEGYVVSIYGPELVTMNLEHAYSFSQLLGLEQRLWESFYVGNRHLFKSEIDSKGDTREVYEGDSLLIFNYNTQPGLYQLDLDSRYPPLVLEIQSYASHGSNLAVRSDHGLPSIVVLKKHPLLQSPFPDVRLGKEITIRNPLFKFLVEDAIRIDRLIDTLSLSKLQAPETRLVAELKNILKSAGLQGEVDESGREINGTADLGGRYIPEYAKNTGYKIEPHREPIWEYSQDKLSTYQNVAYPSQDNPSSIFDSWNQDPIWGGYNNLQVAAPQPTNCKSSIIVDIVNSNWT